MDVSEECALAVVREELVLRNVAALVKVSTPRAR
jgi:hypothetical protein